MMHKLTHCGKYALEIKVWKLVVKAFKKYIASRGLRTLCDGLETPTRHSGNLKVSPTNSPTQTNGLTGQVVEMLASNKLGKWDSYLRNLKLSLTDSLTHWQGWVLGDVIAWRLKDYIQRNLSEKDVQPFPLAPQPCCCLAVRRQNWSPPSQ